MPLDRTQALDLYEKEILRQAPRVLSLMDREEYSVTRGCCDRTYWAWKFVDFPGARFQEALCVLSFLFSGDVLDSEFKKNEKLFRWICSGMEYWCDIQYADGSFDEAYPFERSLAATAFTSFYIGEALVFIEHDISGSLKSRMRQTLARAGTWLIHNDEAHGFLSNHLAAAAAALHHIYLVTGEERYEKRCQYFLQKIFDHQSAEGWYEEYGGADPGYQTHGSFYLVRLWQLIQSKELAESLGRSMTWLAYFIHPDGSIGGEYASRNTQTYYPAAFEMFAPFHSAAAWIAHTMRPSVCSGSAAGLLTIDRYNYFPFLNNLVFAYRGYGEAPADLTIPGEPKIESGHKWFSQAGILRVRRDGYDAIVGTAKGGVLKIFDRARNALLYSDCGYLGRLQGGKVISSQYFDHGRAVTVTSEQVEIHGSFCEVSRPVMNPYTFLGFRIFTLSLGRLSRIGKWLKGWLVKVLIYRKSKVKLDFTRTIRFEKEKITVCDELKGEDGQRLESLHWGEVFSTIHMGSSRYFINNELRELKFVETQNPLHATQEKYKVDERQVVTGVQYIREVKL